MTPLKPMLAVKFADETHLRFPLVASPYIQGVRALSTLGGLIGKTLEPLPNAYLQSQWSCFGVSGLDGVITGPPQAAGEHPLTYWVFDSYVNPELPFWSPGPSRWSEVVRSVVDRHTILGPTPKQPPLAVCRVPQALIDNRRQLQAFEDSMAALGHSGTMVRSLSGGYTFGPTSRHQGHLMLLRPYLQAQGRILEAFKDSLIVDHPTFGLLQVTLGLPPDHTELSPGQTLAFKYRPSGPDGRPLVPIAL